MAITSLDGWVASAKQYFSFAKLAARTTVATGWFSLFDVVGSPGAGVLAGTSTTVGVVPTSETVGCPRIGAFGGGATGYLSQVDFGSSVACRLKILDMLFKAGAYAFTAATTTLASQPSFSSRVPGGTDFTDTQVWIEVSTAFVTGNSWQVRVTYTNQAGMTGRTTTITPALNAAALTLGRMYQLPLQSGDTGVQAIESVIVTNGGTAMTAGAFNVLVLRPLWTGRVRSANDGDVHGLDKTAMPVVYADSALVVAVSSDGTSSGIPELEFVVANG